MATLDEFVPQDISDVSDEMIKTISQEELPHWKELCHNKRASSVSLVHSAFGRSVDELLLMAVGIKYACHAGKEVRVVASEQKDHSKRAV
jgi:hypothetical protein